LLDITRSSPRRCASILNVSGYNPYSYARVNPIKLVDALGMRPVVDKYPTLNSAAIATLGDINPRSRREDIEYGGYIYPNDDGTYSYTVPYRGSPDTTGLGPLRPGKSRSECSSYRTHGAYDPTLDYSRINPNYIDANEGFSPKDEYQEAAAGTPGLVATPKDVYLRYDLPPAGLPPGEGTVSRLR